MYDVSEENIVQVIRTDSTRLLVVFSGIFAVANVGPLDFLREAGFSKDNLIYLRDYYRSSYRKGVSAKLNTFELVMDWCLERVRAIPHVREVFVVGGSSGAMPALLFARAVGARRAVAFGPRTIRPDTLKPMSWKGSPFSRAQRIRQRWHNLVAWTFRRPAKDWATKRDLDMPWLEYAVGKLKERTDDTPDWNYDAYFVATNAVDALVASRLVECPGIHVHPLVPPSAYLTMTRSSGWDHGVIPLLRLQMPLSRVMLDDPDVNNEERDR